jgi:hypothetical protein
MKNRRFLWTTLLALSPWSLWGAPTESPVPPEEVLVSTEADPLPEKPDWFERAEKYFQDAVKAESVGDVRVARRNYGRTLKILADQADDASVLGMRESIAGFLNLADEGTSWPRSGDCPPVTDLSDVSSEDLRNAPPPVVVSSTKSYAIHVDPDDPLVKKYIGLYTGPLRERTQAALNRMARYRTMILEEIERQ